jgi:hypothetical protein
MKKYSVWESEIVEHSRDPGPGDTFSVVYRSSEVDARIAELEHERDELRNALVVSRGQWIHSVNAEQCLQALDG